LAQTVAGSDGVYFVPALAGLGAPHWRDDARGLITGMSLSTQPAHVARAALEAVGLQISDVFAAMEADRGAALSALSADGGASRNDVLMQIQADILRRPVRRSRVAELSAIGVGVMAGIGAGLWGEEQALSRLAGEADIFAPCADEENRNRLVAGWRAAIDQTIAARSNVERAGGR
jgi:glycerol kinase